MAFTPTPVVDGDRSVRYLVGRTEGATEVILQVYPRAGGRQVLDEDTGFRKILAVRHATRGGDGGEGVVSLGDFGACRGFGVGWVEVTIPSRLQRAHRLPIICLYTAGSVDGGRP